MELQDSVQALMLRKPNPVSELIGSVPVPARSVPTNGLPLWYRLPLYNKLPMPKTPKGALFFSRNKLGKPLWVSKGEYNLSDPYCHNVTYEYDPLHDPNLTRFFNEPINKMRMIEMGFVTPHDWAVCTLKQFNIYRRYLMTFHNDAINVVRGKLDGIARDKLTMYFIDQDEEKRSMKLEKMEKARLLNKKNIDANRIAEMEKRKALKDSYEISKQRLQRLEQKRIETLASRKEAARQREQAVLRRLEAAMEIEIKRKIKTIRQWRTDEERRSRRLREEERQRRKQKEIQVRNRWDLLIKSQAEKIEDDQKVLRIYQEDMAASVARYDRRVKEIRYRDESRAERTRLRNRHQPLTFIRPQKKKRTTVEEAARKVFLPKLCCTVLVPDRDARPEDAVRRALKRARAEPRRRGTLAVLSEVRARVEDISRTPTAVLDFINVILEEAIRRFIQRRVAYMIIDVRAIVLDHLKEHKLTKRKKHSSGGPQRKPEAVDQPAEQNTRGVSFSRHQSEMTREVEGIMRSSKGRPPTPVVSATCLAQAVADEENVETLLEEDPDAKMQEKRRIEKAVGRVGRAAARTILASAGRFIDPDTDKITMPKPPKPYMHISELIDAVTEVVLQRDVVTVTKAAELRWLVDWLTYEILKDLRRARKECRRQQRKNIQMGADDYDSDFYTPGTNY